MSLQRSGPPALQSAPAAESVTAPAQPAGQAGVTEQPYFRFDIVRALQLHRKLAMGFAIAGLALAIAYAAFAWPRYTAQSQIYIQPTSSRIMDPGSNAQRWPYDSNSYDSFIQQQVQLASNPDVLAGAMQKLPAGSWQRAGESEQAAAERLGGVLKVERLGSSYQVAISAHAKSARMAADIANAVANSIVEKAALEANAGDTQRIAILQSERDRVQNQLNADLTEQDALNQQLGMAAVGAEAPDLIDNAIDATRQELIKARTDHDQAEARFAALGEGKGGASAALDAAADELVANDPGLTSMKTSLNARRATLITQMANLTTSNPEYKLDAQELTKINASLDVMMKDLRAKAAALIQEKLRTDLERTAGVEAQLNGQLRQLAATAASATPKLQRANDLATDIVRLRTRYAAVDEELHDIMLQDSVPGAVHLSVAAAPPLHPAFAGILRKSVPLALGGILLGLFAALLANHLDPRIYIGSDVEHLLGFAPMAALPDFEEVSNAAFDEHILRLATAIEHARKQGSLRMCIFTGTGMGAGVSTVVTRVRETLASMGRPTVLVNAAGVAPQASRTNLRHSGDSEANAGPFTAEHGTRSLALLRRVTEESDTQDESLVLADTAPLLISAETEYLARFVDCAIVVAESGATTRAELRATVDALQRLDVSAMGLVLNRVSLATADAPFRNSVRGVESHIHVRSRANHAKQRPAPRTHPFADENPAVAAQRDLQPAVTRQPEDVHRQEPSQPAPQPDSATERLAQTMVSPEQYLAEQVAARLRLLRQEAERAAAEQEAERTAAEQAVMKHILEEQFGIPHPVEPVAPQSPSQGPAAVSAPASGPSPATPATLQAAAPPPSPVVPPRLSGTPLTTLAKDQPAQAETPRNPADAAPSLPRAGQFVRPASRLSGLRNVFATNGARELQKRHAGQQGPVVEEQPLPVENAAEFVPGYTAIPEPVPTPVQAVEPQHEDRVQVTAVPEFLPPQSIVMPRAGSDSWGTEANGMSGRLERGDTLDDIQVLPSRRGQYRRNRKG